MKKKLVITVAALISICILAFAVNAVMSRISERKHFAQEPVSPQLSPPTEFSAKMKPISVENISELQEISSFHQEGLGMVVALAEAPLPFVLQAVYKNGTLIQWDPITEKIIALETVFTKQTVEDVDVPVYKINAGVNFNRDGSFLITPSKILADQLYGEIVWNTNSRIRTLKNERFDFQALHLHPTLDIEFKVFNESDDISYGIGVGNEYLGGGGLAVERYGTLELTRIALDPIGDFLATVDINGSILVGDITTFSGSEQEGFFEYVTPYRLFGYSGKEINTVDLEFDETHSWLGWLTDEKLIVWSLKNYVFPFEFSISLDKGNVICFDRTGKILAVGTRDGITIFDVEKGKEISNYPVGEVTALYFTRDNRLLIWGDINSNIHLWKVK